MDGCAVDVISKFTKISRTKVHKFLKTESKSLEVTKSLLNLLYNIVVVGSLPVSKTQKVFFDQNSKIVLNLLGTTKSLRWKKQVLEDNIPLVLNIATSCPTAVGSSSPKTASISLDS